MSEQFFSPPSTSRKALRRLLIVLAVVVGFMIYAYGWTVTEIDLERPQEELRQENVTTALRALLSPNIFQQERAVEIYEAPFLMACETGEVPEQASAGAAGPVAFIEPACAESGDELIVRVLNASPNADARIRWVPPAEEGEEPRIRPREILETGREEIVLDSGGNLTGTIEVPRIRGGEGEIHTVQVQVAVPAGPIQLSETATLVIDRMVQTIFIALVATTVAIPIAGVLSFFAARNLTQQLRLSIGTILVAFIAFVLGIWGGGYLLGPVGTFGVSIGQGDLGAITAFIVPIGVVFGVSFPLGWLNRSDQSSTNGKMVASLNTLIFTLVGVFLVGIIGGLGILTGAQISTLGELIRPEEGGNVALTILGVLVGAVGNLLTILGTLVDLFIGAVGAILAGFAVASIAGNLLGNAVRRLTGVISHVSGAVLGAVSGALLMAFVASLGLWAALLGLLPLLVAAILGGTLTMQIARKVLKISGQENTLQWLQGVSRPARIARWLIFAAGAVTVFVWVFGLLNVGRTLVDGTLPAQTSATLFGTTLPVTRYMFTAMLLGGILTGISGGIAGVRPPFPLGVALYNVSRTSLNVVRSIEPLIMGLVFVIWVGIGPFAGVLALTLHSIAALGKLYSEQIENIDPGPLEALRSTGANQLQTIIYAVVPQIIPPYIAFTMYRWDINVRMSTIIGFVGGGGIGLLLQQQINLLRYREAGVAVLSIAIVVSILDYASALIRERVT